MKIKRFLALAGACALLLLYILTLVFALQKDPRFGSLFFMSLAATILVPIILYAFLRVLEHTGARKSPLIDTIVFDVGSVLVDFPYEEFVKTFGFSEEALHYLEENVYHRQFFRDMDSGLKTPEECIASYIEDAPQFREELLYFAHHAYDCLAPYPYSSDWIRSLKARGYRVYILSNWPKDVYAKCRETGVLSFEDLTDGALWSYTVHLLKPDPAIYKTLAERFSIDPSRALFLDDKAENVEAAKALGFASFRFTDFADARRKMENIGIRF